MNNEIYAPTKEVINYALQLKASKKGPRYIGDMINKRYEGGIEVLQHAATKKNPKKISASNRAALQAVVDASQN